MSEVIEINEVSEPAEETASLKTFLADCREIGKLAKLRGRTIAEIYREICAPTVRAELRDEMTRQAAELSELGTPGE